mmetsp:Transcript_1640/g.3611  ORF Transcript_1640/g.3611 Transcript_1640/m.3611 type:complete len:100 (+) Transcript_1640:58-357(+)|eukprot:CAMPEP_0198240840 /NCGR_PEP_ID=MMETSP1446-20131203/5839_1 /TAXON_ID=1461542 ORGANISM="Unidentified sp, Strain CCMP2111" /NCGR_SAMPLE_ID=MMETSP1446 /ASSEMBLY_ACC=CAM_ASM_001112 /LENGTH=99 /DNA_ID=CAMNT_0043923615 /DNA_START=130 /DNA_END=429 /DNA_ORIENTATION=-
MRRPKQKKDRKGDRSIATATSAGNGGKVDASGGSTSDKERKRTLLDQLDDLRQLPRSSKYARHRKLCIEKALSLLDGDKRSKQEEDQLIKLLAQLNLLK